MLIAELSGSESVVHFDLNGQTWVSQSHGIHPFEVGAPRELHVDVDESFFFDARTAGYRGEAPMARIILEDLRHSYGAEPMREQVWALKRVTLELADGGAYALLGPSGCGKTTLLNLISGLLRPTEGRILFDGADVTDETPEERNIAQVFQFPVIYDTMTVYDNLAFPLATAAFPRPRSTGGCTRSPPCSSSRRRSTGAPRGLTADGKQKISLGRGLVRSDVNVIMFDEPLTVIDPHLKWVLRSKLKELHRASAAR